ncbi:MAG: MFS transporter [Oscillospiraceae bacterium]|nr:MFS transporter [Oscillospiraceae bacterium]
MLALLLIIYLSFIGLGLGDSQLGGAWPSMYAQFGVVASAGGIIAMLIGGGSICATLLSDRVLRRFGTGPIVLAGAAMIALALLGFSFAEHFWMLCLLALPMGLGVGSVDTAGNSFLAKHYSARYINWLHCFWGAGATAGPAVMAFALLNLGGWRAGYRTVSLVLFAIAALALISQPLWRRITGAQTEERDQSERTSVGELIRLPGAKFALLNIFALVSIEAVVGLWGVTFVVTARGVVSETATGWLAIYYFGVMAARILSGFVVDRLGTRRMVRLGMGIIALGIGAFFLTADWALISGFLLIGFGTAPLYPCFISSTRQFFGAERTQAMVGLQVSAVYIGVTFVPPLFGVLGGWLGFGLLPGFIGLFWLCLLGAIGALYRRVDF